MAENEIMEGMQVEELEALANEISLEDLAEFDEELEFDVADLEAAEKPVYTTKEKLKLILMNNKVFSIIKWCFAGLGLIGLVLYVLAMISPDISESLSTTLSAGVRGALTAVSNLLPFSLMEILALVTVVGILGYIGFLVYKTIKEKEGIKIAGLWVQLAYVLLAVFGTGFMLYSMCYGVTTNRPQLYKTYLKEVYAPNQFTEQSANSAMIYYTDMINNVAADSIANDTIFYTASGHSRYASKGDSLDKISKTVNACYSVAKNDSQMKWLGEGSVQAKKLLFSPLYTAMGIGSIYCPITSEVLINTDYPEVIVPMQVARAIAKQRGITNDADASLVAFLVCTRYRDYIAQNTDKYNVDYVAYSAYMDAYLETGAVVYRMSPNRHLYCAAALKESAKKDVTAMVKQLDAIYGNISKLEFTAKADKTPTSDYRVLAKLLYKDYNVRVEKGDIPVTYTAEEPVPARGSSAYCKYLISYFFKEAQGSWGESVESVYEDYNPQPSLNDGSGN
ncbi:MAG: DUF3810 family protein [Clostridia bacterium]|nr:DUF3810 family protein [Clostridia bacterium]